MPALADFLPKVYEITSRPDLVAETTGFLTRALMKAHLAGDYRFDLQTLTIPNTEGQEFSADLPARFRKEQWVYTKDFRIHNVTPAALYDQQVQMEKQNTYYIGGSSINFNIKDHYELVTFDYLQYPTYADSYIASTFPDILTYLASAYVFSLLKNTEAAQRWAGLARDIDVELIRNTFVI